MKYSVTLHERQMQVELSKSAARALRNRDKPIVAVVHLIFGCMVAKRVWFKDQVTDVSIPVTDNLRLSFDVVRYANCSLSNIDGGAEPETFPLHKDKKGYVPDYLFINFSKNSFSGEFTFDRSRRITNESVYSIEHELELNRISQA